MQCVHLICLTNKWETYLPLKTNVTVMQTKYEILISRKQFVQQQIKYITESIHSNSLQTKYFCKQIRLEFYFRQHFFNWLYTVNIGVRQGDILPSFIADL